ncbi:hypothetical protein ACWC9T_37515 [Kitasatospora sp. NPDC001159]
MHDTQISPGHRTGGIAGAGDDALTAKEDADHRTARAAAAISSQVLAERHTRHDNALRAGAVPLRSRPGSRSPTTPPTRNCAAGCARPPPPAKPGDPWLFGGDIASNLVPKACIPGDPRTLGADKFAALGYLRSHLAEGTVGTAEEYATFEGVGSVERAQELFDAVADLVDVRGCPACPTAHLCTRDPEAQPA